MKPATLADWRHQMPEFLRDRRDLHDLVDAAIAARKNAYAPYSGFQVGAALRSTDGRVFCGVNVESASFPVGICAERSAIVAAVTAGARAFDEVVVVTRNQAGQNEAKDAIYKAVPWEKLQRVKFRLLREFF